MILEMEQIRSFIAIELPQEMKVQLARVRGMPRPQEYPSVKWVEAESIHLTLKFLGNIPSGRIPEIEAAVREAARGVPAFHLEIGGLGVFPSTQRPRVAWVAVGGEVEKLAGLQEGIDSALLPLGFPRESRPFTPHLTLARVRERASPQERRSFGELVMSTKFEARLPLEVSAISLMRSRLTAAGAIYGRIFTVGL
jgi:2'-5' RNA ligase